MPDGRTEARQAPVTPQGNPQARGFQKLPQNMERQVLRRNKEGKSISSMHLLYILNGLLFKELEEPRLIIGKV